MSTIRQAFFEHVAQTSDFPMGVEIERAEGNYLIGKEGERYLDLISGISVSNIGHGHPKVLKAIHEQVDAHMHLMVYGEFIQAPQVLLASKLASILPKQLSSCYFVNSGSEAIEGALKLARRYTGRKEIISFVNSYHGSTMGALSLGGTPERREPFEPLVPEMKRLQYGFMEQLQQISHDTAAVVIEPIQAEGGIRVPSAQYMQELRKRCSETGTLLIFDEIQTGMGRTGKFFAFEHFEIVPDVLVLAKGFGGGMPLGAFISCAEIMNCLRSNPILGHITTFGGHPVACAASLAAITVIQDEQLLNSIPSKEKLFREELRHSRINEVRGFGLMLAAELGSFDYVQEVIARCVKGGLITDWFLFCDTALRIAPPLTITEEEVLQACRIIRDSL